MLWMPSLATLAVFIAPTQLLVQEDMVDIPSEKIQIGGDENKTYFLIGPKNEGDPEKESKSIPPPKDGYKLLIIMPGGNGSAEFHAFVKRIYKHAIGSDYLAVQPVAVKWTESQSTIWPTNRSKVPKMKFGTEEFVEEVVSDVQERHKIDPRYVFTLSWSSSGPAAYTISLEKKKSVTGSFIAMSIFQQNGSLKTARNHPYFLYHSPEDKVCRFDFAEEAEKALKRAKAKVKLVTYEGGHGWRGPLYRNIKEGIGWLEENVPSP